MADHPAQTLDRWGFPVRLVRLTPPPQPAKKAPVKRSTTQHGAGSYSPGLDSGLRKLSETQQPGQTFSCAQIAKECDVSKDTIALLERQALRKIRSRLSPSLFSQFQELLNHDLSASRHAFDRDFDID